MPAEHLWGRMAVIDSFARNCAGAAARPPLWPPPIPRQCCFINIHRGKLRTLQPGAASL